MLDNVINATVNATSGVNQTAIMGVAKPVIKSTLGFIADHPIIISVGVVLIALTLGTIISFMFDEWEGKFQTRIFNILVYIVVFCISIVGLVLMDAGEIMFWKRWF